MTLICYYGAGLPLALFFGFSMEQGIYGFWLGFLVAVGLLDIVIGYIVYASSWKPLVKQKEVVSDSDKTDQLKRGLIDK
jgi:Na+-driven multidrug efflux pump